MTSLPSSPRSSDAPYGQAGSPVHHGGPAPAPGPTPEQGSPRAAGPSPAGPAPGTDLAADLGAGLTFAGQAMLRNPVAYLVSGLVYSVLMLVITLGAALAGAMLIIARTEAQGHAAGPGVADVLLVVAVVYGVMLLALPLSLLWQAGAARSGMTVLEGGRPGIGQAMIGPIRIILTALLYAAIVAVGLLLLYLPGLVAAVMLFYAVPAAARGAGPVRAITESWRLTTRNLGTTVIAYLVVSAIASFVGMFVITLVVLIPFLVLFQLGMYERVSGRTLPEPARA